MQIFGDRFDAFADTVAEDQEQEPSATGIEAERVVEGDFIDERVDGSHERSSIAFLETPRRRLTSR
ncbi:hypothetical protein ASG39_05705 [Rhizobium sp. Leaf371]|nr:hypothetical protein ASG39_05705 [Rhizobium sp. Leaf371]